MIKEFSEKYIYDKRHKPPVLYFDKLRGEVRFSVAAVEALKLKERSKIKFVWDDRDDLSIVYFYEDPGGWPLYPNYTENGKVWMRYRCKGVVLSMLDYFNAKGNLSLPIKGDRVKVAGKEAWFVKK